MLTHEQTVDLAQLQALAEERGAEVVIIGAAALLCFMDLGRFIRDIDLVVALDLALPVDDPCNRRVTRVRAEIP